MDKSTKYILLAGGAYLAWRAYSLNKLSNKIDYSPSGAKIDVDKKSRKITLTLLLKVTNPTQVNVTVTDTLTANILAGNANTQIYDAIANVAALIAGAEGTSLAFSIALG